MARKPLLGQGLLIIEPSRSYSDTPQSVWPFWTSNQPTQRPLSDNIQVQQSEEIGIRAPGGIRTRNPRKPVAADPSRLYTIFPHYLINGTIFDKTSFNIKCVF